MPHKNIDPAPAVAAIVQSLYAIVARETYFTEENAAVISITKIHVSRLPLSGGE